MRETGIAGWFKRILVALFLFSTGAFLMPNNAEAVCGKQCREARDYCKNWEASHPGQTCGYVRGAICTGSAWDKIKQVNTLWSACRLVEGSADHAAAQLRCDAFEENWGGDCEVHSPLCNAGWIKLQKYGKFRACRKIEFTGTILDLYRAYMRKWEGLADTPIPAHLKPFIQEQYGFDPNWVRWGRVPNTDNSTCITDCNRINCDKDWVLDRVREGYNWNLNAEGGETNLLFHEMTHVKQCMSEGGRDAYAMLWFSNLPLGIINTLILGNKVNADNIHDAMPMEVEGTENGWTVLDNYVQGWWHKEALCRIYHPNRKFVIFTSQDPHPRAFCDFKYDWQGARYLKEKIKELSLNYGNGTYYVGFGRPDEDNGVWIGSLDIQNPIVEAEMGVTVSGEICPKPVELNVLIATDKERSVRLRYKVGDDWSGWKQVQSKDVGTGFLAQFKHTAEYYAGPGKQTVKVEIGDYPRILQREIDVECPPFAPTKVDYAVRVGSGDLCPRKVEELINFETNGPGTVRFGFREMGKSDLDSSPSYVAATKRWGNKYVASFDRSKMEPDEASIDRRVETLGIGLIFSDWQDIDIECLEVLDSAIVYDGPTEKTCDYQTDVKLRINADMESDLPYRLDCADGQSREGIFDIRNTGPGTFIGVDALKLDVTKTGKQICVLKANLGAGLRNLTLQGVDLTCLDVLDAGLYIDGPDQGPCPAELDVRARFNGRDKTAVGFGLACSTGQSWTGKLPVEETSPGTFVGITTKKLEVTESGQIACALKSHLTGEPKIVALRGKTFQCIDVARPGPSGDLTVDQREPDTAMAEDCVEPVPSADDNPVGHAQAMLSRLGFDPGPVDGQMGPRTGAAIEAFQQIGELPVTGTVDGNVLQALQAYGTIEDGDPAGVPCASPQEAVEEVAAEPEPEQQAEEPSPPAIADPAPQVSVCRNGAIRGGDCVCRRDWTRTRVSRFEYVCNRPVVRIACDNGTVRAGQCVCRPGWRLNRIAPNRFECLRPVARIVCDGGKVRGGRCVCPQDTVLRQRSANNFQCMPSRPRRIVCTDGVVRDNQCFCPRATTRQTLGPNRFQCACPRGLRLVRGQCIRPAG